MPLWLTCAVVTSTTGDTVDYHTRHRLLSKIHNRTTNRSHVFMVWTTVGFFEAHRIAGTSAAAGEVQIGAEAGDMARQVARGQGLPAPKYPRHFSVAVNRQVARSLDLAVEDETVLRERLMRLERD